MNNYFKQGMRVWDKYHNRYGYVAIQLNKDFVMVWFDGYPKKVKVRASSLVLMSQHQWTE